MIQAPQTITSESSALAAWYGSHAAIRQMWAFRNARTLRVVVILEPTIDDSDVYPAWFANSDTWIQELRSYTDSLVELELIVEPMIPEVETAIEGDLVVAMSWRDPTVDF